MSRAEEFEQLRSLLRGDERVAAFPEGTGLAHAFIADFLGEELEFLSVGERKDKEVVLYPDSGKVLVVGDHGRGRGAQERGGAPARGGLLRRRAIAVLLYSPECVEGRF